MQGGLTITDLTCDPKVPKMYSAKSPVNACGYRKTMPLIQTTLDWLENWMTVDPKGLEPTAASSR
jgi:hypothetical protein